MPDSSISTSEDNDFATMLEAYIEVAQPEQGELLKGTVVEINSEGILVDLGLKREGLVPMSDLERAEKSTEQYGAGSEIEVLVTVHGHGAKNPILSVYQALQHQSWKDAEKLLGSGDIVTGTVESFNRGGIIVTYLDLPGFVPASHVVGISRGIAEVKRKEVLEGMVGKDISVRVIEVDRQRHRLVLSQRAAQRSIRAEQKDSLIAELYEGQVLDGTIINVRDFGAFVDLGAADGLVHVSELAWQQVDNPNNVVQPGDEVKVMVIKIDRKRQRIGLSIKQLLPSPWDSVEERLAAGQNIVGRVTRILDFGAFIDLGEGIEGLLHTSQIPEKGGPDIIVGSDLNLRIVSLDVQRHRVSLSLQDSPTDQDSGSSNSQENVSIATVAESDGEASAESTDDTVAESDGEASAESTDDTVAESDGEASAESTDDTVAESDRLIKGGEQHDEGDN